MTRRIGRPALVAVAAIFCASALLLAHDAKKKTAMTGDMMNECGDHHTAAKKASEASGNSASTLPATSLRP